MQKNHQRKAKNVTVEGLNDGCPVSVYTVNGIKLGSAVSQNGVAQIGINLPADSIAIIKVGQKKIKMFVK